MLAHTSEDARVSPPHSGRRAQAQVVRSVRDAAEDDRVVADRIRDVDAARSPGGAGGLPNDAASITPPPADLALPADGPPPGYVTAETIAAELARVTGKRSVPTSTIRAMASRGQLPPTAETRWGRRSLWEADAIAAWLRDRESRHVPKATVRQIQRRLAALDEQARRTGNDARLKQGVRNAYRRGLSFQQIADAIKAKNGDHHPSREAVRTRFRAYL